MLYHGAHSVEELDGDRTRRRYLPSDSAHRANSLSSCKMGFGTEQAIVECHRRICLDDEREAGCRTLARRHTEPMLEARLEQNATDRCRGRVDIAYRDQEP